MASRDRNVKVKQEEVARFCKGQMPAAQRRESKSTYLVDRFIENGKSTAANAKVAVAQQAKLNPPFPLIPESTELPAAISPALFPALQQQPA